MNDRHAELIRKISETAFYMDDLRLYLDTHPNCSEAIALYNSYSAKYMELKEKYNEMYGPLNYYQGNQNCNLWQWTSYSWPWEGAC